MGDYGLMKHAGYFGTYLILTLDRLRQQRWLLAGLVLLCLLLPLGAALRSELILYAALLSYVLAVAVWFRFNRCPHCRKHLGRHTGIYCPYCKEKL